MEEISFNYLTHSEIVETQILDLLKKGKVNTAGAKLAVNAEFFSAEDFNRLNKKIAIMPVKKIKTLPFPTSRGRSISHRGIGGDHRK